MLCGSSLFWARLLQLQRLQQQTMHLRVPVQSCLIIIMA
jgi:hypothetical protein